MSTTEGYETVYTMLPAMTQLRVQEEKSGKEKEQKSEKAMVGMDA